MLKSFTDRARHVMARAAVVAHEHRHDFVGSEHVFLALVAEGDGLAVKILRTLGVDVARAAEAVGRLLPPGACDVLPKRPRYTPGAKAVLETAEEEADALEHEYLGTEHLLLGMLRETGGGPAVVLAGLGVDLKAVREGARKGHERPTSARGRTSAGGGFALVLDSLGRVAELQTELIQELARQAATPEEEARVDAVQAQADEAGRRIREICRRLGMEDA